MKGILLICGALAAGEYLASFFPSFAALWPVVAFALVLVALFGYGFAVRFWPFVFFFLLGVGLFLRASTDDVLLYREQPWLRGRELRARRSSVATSPAWVRPVRADLARRMSVGLEDDRAAADLVRAIVLGERGRLRSDLKSQFLSRSNPQTPLRHLCAHLVANHQRLATKRAHRGARPRPETVHYVWRQRGTSLRAGTICREALR